LILRLNFEDNAKIEGRQKRRLILAQAFRQWMPAVDAGN
jgi:collagenase-like PrtC family protease